METSHTTDLNTKSQTEPNGHLSQSLNGKITNSMNAAKDLLAKDSARLMDETKVGLKKIEKFGEKVGNELSSQSRDYVRSAKNMIRQRPLTSIAVIASLSALTTYAATRLQTRSCKQ